ncbi:F0F1 ATP synthase subunit epsilon [Pseudoxanthobacter sp.]|uniref:F0F1 ATP synthase subunit epsilon n=1 Tax=Pseudoxanthobacter sp. TaxID=1925742 RepID=UPI002FE0D131
MAETFTFELVSPERLLLSEEARSVVAPGTEGAFEIMKGHAPFLSTLRPGFVEATLASGEKKRVYVRGGFADAGPTRLTVLADVAIPAESLRREQVQAAIADFEAVLASAQSDEARYKASATISQLREVEAQL